MMDLKALITDEDAVSPVIGVILMVAITVILAAVIGAFVLNIGGSQEQVPQANWDIEYPSDDYETSASYDTSDQIVVSHGGGGAVDVSTLSVKIGSGTAGATINNLGDASTSDYIGSGDDFADDSVTAGDSVTISEYDDDSGSSPASDDVDLEIQSGDEVDIIWSSSSSDSSQVIGEGVVP